MNYNKLRKPIVLYKYIQLSFLSIFKRPYGRYELELQNVVKGFFLLFPVQRFVIYVPIARQLLSIHVPKNTF